MLMAGNPCKSSRQISRMGGDGESGVFRYLAKIRCNGHRGRGRYGHSLNVEGDVGRSGRNSNT
jgi:hypothetical protein